MTCVLVVVTCGGGTDGDVKFLGCVVVYVVMWWLCDEFVCGSE